MEDPTRINRDKRFLVGRKVQSTQGEHLGHIVEVIRAQRQPTIEYVVLEVNGRFGRARRFFAIPAFSSFIKAGHKEMFTLMVDTDELPLARGVRVEQLPKPNIAFNPAILELYSYAAPEANRH